MHILIVLITALLAIGVWIWRARAAAAVSHEVLDVAADAKAALRRFGYRQKAGRHPADSVDDPRLAAAGMMAAIAKMDGDITAAQMNALRVECRATFRVDQKEADDIAAFGRWLAGQSQDPGDGIRRLAKIVRDRAGAEAHSDLVRMLGRIASVEGGAPSEIQTEAITLVKRSLAVADA